MTTRCPLIAVPEGLCSPSDRFAGRCGESLKNWFRVENAAQGADTTEAVDIVIDGPIVDQFMSDFLGIGVSSADVVNAIMQLRGQPLNVWINSDGGIITSGLAIYNQLLMHDAPVTTIVYGGALSIASVIAMAGGGNGLGGAVVMAPASMLFIHEAHSGMEGTAADFRQEAGLLDQLSEQIAGVYARRGDSRVNWRSLMQAGSGPSQGTLITAEEAVRRKLADRIDTKIARQPANALDMSRYVAAARIDQVGATEPEGAPDAETEPETEDILTIRAAERALREAGFSNSRAKTIVAKGWHETDRDDPPNSSGMDEPEPEAEDVQPVEAPSVAAQALIDARNWEALYVPMLRLSPLTKG